MSDTVARDDEVRGDGTVRTAYKVWSGIAAGVFCIVAISDLGSSPTTAASAPAAATAPAPTYSAVAPTYRPAAPPAPSPAAAPTVTVTEVVDGDTLVVGGRRIGLLGIDACPVSTDGGTQAKSLAESMVAYDHTGAVDNGADAAYLAGLRDADPDGRTCSVPAPTSSSGYDDDGSIDYPSPGDQGLPDGALTGGYCKRKWWC